MAGRPESCPGEEWAPGHHQVVPQIRNSAALPGCFPVRLGRSGKHCGRSQKIGHKGGWNIKHRVPPSPYPWPSGAICVVAMTRWEGTPGADEHPSHRNHAAPVERNGKLMIDRIRIECLGLAGCRLPVRLATRAASCQLLVRPAYFFIFIPLLILDGTCLLFFCFIHSLDSTELEQ